MPSLVSPDGVSVGVAMTEWTAAFTNIVKGARNYWLNAAGNADAAVDADGWPTEDAIYYFEESIGRGLDPLMTGRITGRFTGQGVPSVFGNVVGTIAYSYDSGSNTTSFHFDTLDVGGSASGIRIFGTSRDGTVGGPGGFTGLAMMRPSSPGASTSYAFDAPTFTPQQLAMLGRYTCVRCQLVDSQERDWADRTPPTWFNQSAGTWTSPHFGNGDRNRNGPSWEYKVLLANAAGCDLVLSIPPTATDAYVTKLANLIRYGSDGAEPYTSTQSGPAYPPLRSDLKLYFEPGNELWNFSGSFNTFYKNVNSLATAIVQAAGADLAAINYDGLSTALQTINGGLEPVELPRFRYRTIMLIAVRWSLIFRGVFGDSAMMARIRPLYLWQYNDLNGTGSIGLDFLRDWYGNPAHVSPAHAAGYYIWGGGGATYFGALNPDGVTDVLPDPGFESTVVAEGYTTAPADARWTFTGAAGIARPGQGFPEIVAPFAGSQVGWIRDAGRISTTFTIPMGATSNVYAVAFRALARRQGSTTETPNLRVFVDGNDLTAGFLNQPDGYTPRAYNSDQPWTATLKDFVPSRHYPSLTFTAAGGATHTLEIRGTTTSPANQLAWIDDVRVCSLDAIFATGNMPVTGDANGQDSGQGYADLLAGMAGLCAGRGIELFCYEGGVGLGGDDEGSPLQQVAKYSDGRMADVQLATLEQFRDAGGKVSILGTYRQWGDWADFVGTQGLADPDSSALVRGVTAFLAGTDPGPTATAYLTISTPGGALVIAVHA